MDTMRHLLAGLLLALTFALMACRTGPARPDGDASRPGEAEAAKDAPELRADEAHRLVRSTERNVNHFQELQIQGQTRQMVSLRRAIARTVDENFATFETMATTADLRVQRNMAVKCLGFALEKRTAARDLLVRLCDDANVTIVSNAALGLGILGDRETDLTPLVKLLAHGDVEVRTNAATALKSIYLVRETPRELTAQHWAAIDRLIALQQEKTSTRARRAAVWALANLRHPDVLDHLFTALKDDDEYVQIGGLYGIKLLGDQRALEPLLEYLEDSPTSTAGSWAHQALVRIAVQGGFAKAPSELADLGTSARSWRRWFRAARMR
jgi:HEAT repeat protein